MNSPDLMRQAISEARDANRAVDNHANNMADLLDVFEAEQVRDRILTQMGSKTDGN